MGWLALDDERTSEPSAADAALLVVAVSIRTPALRRRHAAFPLALQRLRGLIAGS